MAIHLKYGGSTAARTIQCPAWHRLADEAPVKVGGGSNPAADTGTLLHDVCEQAVKLSETPLVDDKYYNALPINVAKDLLDDDLHYNGIHYTPDLYEEKVVPALESVHALWNTYDVEQVVTEPFVKIDDDMGGSIDLLMFSQDKKTVVIADYKMGFNTVTAENNKQLQFYALAAACSDQFASYFDTVERVVLAIIQPNNDGDDLDVWETSMATIDQFESEYLTAVDESENSQAAPCSGPNCTYCPAMATCPAKTGAALKASRVNEITADKLAEYLPLADEVEGWIKEVRKLAHEQLELGTAIHGYKLVNKRASRVWNDQPAVETKVRHARKIKIEDGFDMKLKSPAQLEKLCKKLGVDFEKQYGQYVSAVSSGTTLVKDSDKRPPALPVQGLAQLNALND